MKTSNKVLFGGLTAFFLTIVLLALVGRTTAEIKTKVDCDGETKIVKDLNFEFESISVSQNIEVLLSQGDDFKVQLEASEQIVESVNHYVEDGVLNLGFEDRKGKACTTKFRIQCPTLKSATVANGGRILTNASFTVSDLQLQASNGSSMTMDLVSDNVSVKVMNGSNVAVEGQTINLDVNASNSSSVDAAKGAISSANVSLANSSSAVIKSDTIVSANVINSSSLQYIGDTQLQDIRTVNSSSISKRGE